jgi:hypothetical protein
LRACAACTKECNGDCPGKISWSHSNLLARRGPADRHKPQLVRFVSSTSGARQRYVVVTLVPWILHVAWSHARSITVPLNFGEFSRFHQRERTAMLYRGKPAPPGAKLGGLPWRKHWPSSRAASPHLQPLLHFILCTGARLSEALELRWEDVDLPALRVVFRDTKRGADRPAALPPAAVLALANLPGEREIDGRWVNAARSSGAMTASHTPIGCGSRSVRLGRRSPQLAAAGLIAWEPSAGAGAVQGADGPATSVRWRPTLTPTISGTLGRLGSTRLPRISCC